MGSISQILILRRMALALMTPPLLVMRPTAVGGLAVDTRGPPTLFHARTSIPGESGECKFNIRSYS